jgi:predicted ATPase with chaperone activity
MKAFLRVVIDRGAKGFEVTASTTCAAAMSDVSCAGLGAHLRQCLATPKFIEALDPRLYFELVARLANICQVDRKHVGAVDVLDVPPAAMWLVFARN